MTREENDEDERQRFDYRRARVTHASVSTSARTACVADGAYIITAYLPHVVCAYACERRTGACAPHAPALSRVWALDHAARVSSLAFDASSCVLASGDDAGVIVIRNVRDDDDDDAPQERIAHRGGDRGAGARAERDEAAVERARVERRTWDAHVAREWYIRPQARGD